MVLSTAEDVVVEAEAVETTGDAVVVVTAGAEVVVAVIVVVALVIELHDAKISDNTIRQLSTQNNPFFIWPPNQYFILSKPERTCCRILSPNGH
jgi:hypothetical protein